MRKSSFPVFKAPSRQIVLVSDDRFFVRNVPLMRGPEAAPVEEQIELALETMAPFPVAQLYYGYHTKPELARALVFAAYRKRFTAEEVEAWAEADWVGPRFAALLGAMAPSPATTWVLTAGEALTVVHFGDHTGVPTEVRTHRVAEEANDAQRSAARDALVRGLGGSHAVVELTAIDVQPGEPGDADLVFRAEGVRSELSLAAAEALDVRDKGELVGRRRARARDRWLWRGLLTSVLVIGLCALLELVLIGAQAWQQTRLMRVAGQTPVVQQIMTAQTLATRIDELSTKRLMPFEMIQKVGGAPRPPTIQFLTTTTTGLYTLEVQAQTNAQPDIEAYRTALAALPDIRSVEVQDLRVREGLSTFRLVVTFAPGALNVEREEQVS